MTETFESWWGNLGPITKFTIVMCFGTTAAFSFGVVDPMLLVLDLYSTFTSLQVWRVVTAPYFFGKFGFPWLINSMMLVMWTQRNEEERKGRPADMVYMLIILIATLHVLGFVFGLMLLSGPLLMALVWAWCRTHEDAVLKIYMFSFKGTMFPWAMVLFHLVLGQSIMDDLIGIAAGHVYYFLNDVVPKTHHRVIISTPRWLTNLFPNQRLGAYTVHAPPQARAMPAPGEPQRHNWGRGNALGN